jgi:hypothetical protein
MKSAIGISTKVFDLNGNIILHDVDDTKSSIEDYRHRVTRVATLDTGAYIDDRGYVPGDRTVEISATTNQSEYEKLLYIFKTYTSLLISLPDGAFNGNLSRLSRNKGRTNLTVLIESAA